MYLCINYLTVTNSRIEANNTMMKIVLSSYNEMYVINCNSVLYMQADDHYTHVTYISGAHFMVPFGLSKVEQYLHALDADERFLIRVGRKYIINIHHVFHVNTVKQVILLADANGKNHSLTLPKQILRNLIEMLSGNVNEE